MALLLHTLPGGAPNFVTEFKRIAPDLEVRVWPEVGNPDDIEFAAVHFFDCKKLRKFKNLKFLASLFAGLDHLVKDPGLPEGLPIVRASDQAVVASNDNWMDAANAPVLEGKGLAPKHPNEAALLVTLPPGAYTAIVSGAGGATGIAVVGVYRVN